MVLETLFPVKKIIKHPLDMFIFSMIMTFVSIFLTNLIFPGASEGKIVILFITISVSPMFYLLFEEEEESERKVAEHRLKQSFFERYEDTIWLFTLFFLGVFAAIFVLAQPSIVPVNMLWNHTKCLSQFHFFIIIGYKITSLEMANGGLMNTYFKP